MSKSYYRDVIHDTHSSMLEGAALGESGDSIQLTEGEFAKLRHAWETLGARLHATREPVGFHWNGREYTFVPHKNQILLSSSGSLTARLQFAPDRSPLQHVGVTYVLFRASGGVPTLSFIGNPTTILRGNNIGPVAVLDARNTHAENLALYRIGFQLVEHLLPAFRWSDLTRARIRRCAIRLNNTQWAIGLPTSDIVTDLALLVGLYCGRTVSERTSASLGEYLGFDTTTAYRNETGELTGLFLVKRRGKNHVLTVNWYDKRASVAARYQTGTLSAVENALVDNTIRLDITAHAEFLRMIIAEARRHCVELIRVRPHTARRWTARMPRRGEPPYAFMYQVGDGYVTRCEASEVTARRLCDAMWLLGFTAEARPRQRGWSAWLLDRVLEREMRLFALLTTVPERVDARLDPVTDARVQRVVEQSNSLLDVWQHYEGNNNWVDFVESAATTLRTSVRTVQRCAEYIRTVLGLDITIPYAYWVDLGVVSAGYGLNHRDRALFHRCMYDSTMTAGERGAILERLGHKRNTRLNSHKRNLVDSLRLVAAQIEAVPVRVRHLSKQRAV